MIIFVALLAGCSVERDPFEHAEHAKLSVTVEDLTKAYDSNEAAAQSTYGGHILEVAAKVESIKLNRDDEPFVNLNGGALLPAQLSFAKPYASDAESLKAGQEAVFECLTVTELLGSPMLSDCRIKR